VVDARIKHVVVLMLENRSFDHMLGALHHGGLKPVDGPSNPRDPRFPDRDLYAPTPLTTYEELHHDPKHAYADVMKQLTAREGPWDAPVLTNTGFAWNYHERTGGNGSEVMGYHTKELLPVLYRLAREYAVCARWFCSVPSETWPNRLFAHAGTSDNEVGNVPRAYYKRTVFEVLSSAGHGWRIYAGDIPQVAVFPALWKHHGYWRFFRLGDFFADARANRLQEYSFIEPRHFGSWGSSQHPRSRVLLGEELIRDVYEAIASNPKTWESTMLLITYDEHGGFFDRKHPPTAHPPYEGAMNIETGFRFDLLGPRVPAIVVSPYVKRLTVDNESDYDHTSIIATLCDNIDLHGALGGRVANAKSFRHLLTESTPRDPLRLPAVPPLPVDDLGVDEWASGLNLDSTIRLNDLQEQLVRLAQNSEHDAWLSEQPAPGFEQTQLLPIFETEATLEHYIEKFRRRLMDQW
jgi:phospholipase C